MIGDVIGWLTCFLKKFSWMKAARWKSALVVARVSRVIRHWVA